MLKLPFLLVILFLVLNACQFKNKNYQPNVILILADDMGYGDVGIYNPDSKIPTPNIDQLGTNGMMFTDAHTNSSVCTPTRYGIVTGQYAWRGPLKMGVTWSYDTCIIENKEQTIADLMKSAGYKTACIGKWHLGLGWQKNNDSILFHQPLTFSPNDLGFDYFYGLSASLDIPPYVYIENRNCEELPNGTSEGTSKEFGFDFWRKGPIAPNFKHNNVLEHLTNKALSYIENHKKGAPFFLYLPLTAPHIPWVPSDDFKGKTAIGAYGDINTEVDFRVGQIMNKLKESGIENNTLVIFTSDNGSPLSAEKMEKYNHRANYCWRGRKGDIYEGGNRVPFIASWPGKIKPGAVSDQLVSTTDFLASFAELTGISLTNAKDSKSFYSNLMDQKNINPRHSMVYHSSKGMFAIRSGNWVMVDGIGSGGFLGNLEHTEEKYQQQLYHLANNKSQVTNVVSDHGEVVDSLQNILNKIK